MNGSIQLRTRRRSTSKYVVRKYQRQKTSRGKRIYLKRKNSGLNVKGFTSTLTNHLEEL